MTQLLFERPDCNLEKTWHNKRKSYSNVKSVPSEAKGRVVLLHMSRMFMKISENFPVMNVINNSKGIRIVFIKRKATIA